MALDTTPGPACESLVAVVDATTYHESRGNVALWAPLDTEAKEQRLRDAYDYLLYTYGPSWPAGRTFGTLADGSVPRALLHASAWLALEAINGPLIVEAAPQKLRSEVGPIVSVFAETKSSGRRYPMIDRMVGPHLAPVRAFCVPLERS